MEGGGAMNVMIRRSKTVLWNLRRAGWKK